MRTDAKEAGGMTTFRALFAALMVVASFGLAIAKLPPPPPMDAAAKTAADEKNAKDAAAAEATKQLQARTEDRVAARYIAEQRAKGVAVTPQMGATASASSNAAKASSPKSEKAMKRPPAKR
jgi:hypothetical protein